MRNVIVAGIGTGVGKTIVSAILTRLFSGNYWKPIQCGNLEQSDTQTVKNLLSLNQHSVYPPAYALKAPLSPHEAARLENTVIDPQKISPPRSPKNLIIETVGGIFTPLTQHTLSIDLFGSWEAHWIVVSRHYLGSLNHTFLTLEALKNRKIPLLGIIFNGKPHLENESLILQAACLPRLGRLLPERLINPTLIQRYAQQWLPQFPH
jgi:dethiobiotin synthetase